MDLKLFLSTLGIIFLSELPDKTALASLFLASSNNPWAVFLGACGALTIQSAISVAFGSLFSFLPQKLVHATSGVLFLIFAVVMWRRLPGNDASRPRQHEKGGISFLGVAWATFLIIFLAEWGDLTQLVTVTLEARWLAPVTIFCAATLGLWLATGLSVVVGHQAKRFINPRILQKVAAVVFLMAGLFLILQARFS